jgi:hypothetical protein
MRLPPPRPTDTQDAPGGVLEYRSPSTGLHRVQRAMRALEADETLGAASVGIKLVVGILLCLLPPLVVALLLKRIEWRLRADFLPGFEGTFLVATAILVPLLMRLERRTRGRFNADGLRDGMSVETTRYDASSVEGFRLRSPALEWQVYAEVALTGPVLVRSVIDAVSGKVPADPPLRVVAAQIAIEVYDAGQSVALQELVRLGRPPWVVSQAIHYLLRRGWVCMSVRRDRVLLTTPAVSGCRYHDAPLRAAKAGIKVGAGASAAGRTVR